MPILSPTFDNVARAVECLRLGELIGLPTETVYGVAARGDSDQAVAKIFRAKGRPASNPLILHVANANAARKWYSFSDKSVEAGRFEKAASLWPGPLTIIGPKTEGIPEAVTAGGSTVAIRVPSHPVAMTVLQRLNFPVAAPSANPSNYISPTLPEHVEDGLGDSVSLILDGGPCTVGLESTILSLGDESTPPTILRLGSISAYELSQCLGEPVMESADRRASASEALASSPISSPGQFPRHYSPRTSLRIGFSHADQGGDRVLRIVQAANQSHQIENLIALSDNGDLDQVASNLYGVLRRADHASFDRIEIEPCAESTAMGRAIMDRIRRAAADDRLEPDEFESDESNGRASPRQNDSHP